MYADAGGGDTGVVDDTMGSDSVEVAETEHMLASIIEDVLKPAEDVVSPPTVLVNMAGVPAETELCRGLTRWASRA